MTSSEFDGRFRKSYAQQQRRIEAANERRYHYRRFARNLHRPSTKLSHDELALYQQRRAKVRELKAQHRAFQQCKENSGAGIVRDGPFRSPASPPRGSARARRFL